jgi:hypothetical protein
MFERIMRFKFVDALWMAVVYSLVILLQTRLTSFLLSFLVVFDSHLTPTLVIYVRDLTAMS